MTRRRLLLLLAPLMLVVVAVAGVLLLRGGGGSNDSDSAEPLQASETAGPDVGVSVTEEGAKTLDQLQWEADQAYAEEQRRYYEAMAAELAAYFAELRRQDDLVADAAIKRWGKEQLLLALPSLDITASISNVGFERDGITPATINAPWAVGWYTFSDWPGTGGNAVLSGHVDWYTGAPAVFGRLRNIKDGDAIYMILPDATPVVYSVATSYWVPADTADVSGIYGPTENEAVTFITCGGTWNAVTHDYSHRLIVRAYRVR